MFQRGILAGIFGTAVALALFAACGSSSKHTAQATPQPVASFKGNPMHLSLTLQPDKSSKSLKPYYIYLNTPPPNTAGCDFGHGTITLRGRDEIKHKHKNPQPDLDYYVCH